MSIRENNNQDVGVYENEAFGYSNVYSFSHHGGKRIFNCKCANRSENSRSECFARSIPERNDGEKGTSIRISKNEVKGTSKCMLGLVYIMLSKDAHASGNDMLEHEYLSRARKQLIDGLKLDPIPSVRVIAEDLLKKI